MMSQGLRMLFHLLVLRPFLYLWIGFNVTGREQLPTQGPAIIVCNHNSHLDTFALMTLLPVRLLTKIRPVAAADYFLKNRLLKWYSMNIMRIIPVERSVTMHKRDPLEGAHQALENGDVLIIYPEGTRGESEDLVEFKKGIAHLAAKHPEVPVYPVHIRGLGTVLPKGSHFPLPYFCDIAIGEARFGDSNRAQFIKTLQADVELLAAHVQ